MHDMPMIMKRQTRQKILGVVFVFFFAFQAISSLCCCLEMSKHKEYSPSRAHVTEQGADKCDHDQKNREDPHAKCGQSSDRCQCGHLQKLSVLSECNIPSISTNSIRIGPTAKPVIFFKANVPKVENSLKIFDIGPPGFGRSFSPLYLQISSLRI